MRKKILRRRRRVKGGLNRKENNFRRRFLLLVTCKHISNEFRIVLVNKMFSSSLWTSRMQSQSCISSQVVLAFLLFCFILFAISGLMGAFKSVQNKTVTVKQANPFLYTEPHENVNATEVCFIRIHFAVNNETKQQHLSHSWLYYKIYTMLTCRCMKFTLLAVRRGP